MSYTIVTKQVEETPVLVQRRKVTREELGPALGEMLPAVFAFASRTGVGPAGAPFVRYTAMESSEGFSIEAGLPVTKATEGEGEIHSCSLPGGKVAMTVHKGPYEELHLAHRALEAWVEENGARSAGARWEAYINDPVEVGDPAEFLTEVYLPIED